MTKVIWPYNNVILKYLNDRNNENLFWVNVWDVTNHGYRTNIDEDSDLLVSRRRQRSSSQLSSLNDALFGDGRNQKKPCYDPANDQIWNIFPKYVPNLIWGSRPCEL